MKTNTSGHGRVEWPSIHPYDRFWNSIEKTDSCWIWKGTISKEGYGLFVLTGWFYAKQTRLLAHRFMLTLVNGTIAHPHIHHKCSNRKCVNPEHLIPVTAKEHSQLELEIKRKEKRLTFAKRLIYCRHSIHI